MKRIVYFNGKYIHYNEAKVSIEDRGLQFADSIYEVIAFKKLNFIDLNFHIKRLKYSLSQLNISLYDDNSTTVAGTYKCKLEFIVETKEKLRVY